MKKITLEEFWNSKRKLAIHCSTSEKANKLLNAFDFLGHKWHSGESYNAFNNWHVYMTNTCYSNERMYGDCRFYKSEYTKIYEFEEIDDILLRSDNDESNNQN